MKKILLFTLALLLGATTWADDKKNVSVPVGGRRALYMHFNIRSYQMKPKEGIIQVEEDDDDAGKLHIIGLAVGECDLKIEGLGVQETYHVAVISDMVAIKARLERELHDIGLFVETNQDNLIIKGNVSRHDDWVALENALTGLDKKRVRNDARYQPGEDDLKQIRLMLGRQFKLADDITERDNLRPGEIHLDMNETGLTLTGKGIPEKRKADIERLLSRFPWLAVERNADKSKGEISVWLDIFDNKLDIILKQLQEIANANEGLNVQGTLGHIEINGDVTSGQAWNAITRLVALSGQDLVQNNALFKPSGKALEELEQLFAGKGYECVETDVERYRQINLKLLPDNSLTVTAQISNEEQQEDIAQTLQNQKWLVAEEATQGQMKLNPVKINMIPVNLAVDIAVIRINDGKSKARGADKDKPPFSASIDLGRLFETVTGRAWGETDDKGNKLPRATTTSRSTGGHGTFNIGLKGALNFLDSNNISTTYDAGVVKFQDGGKGHFKDGGSVYLVRIQNDEEQLDEVEFGLDLTVEGHLLANEKMAELTLTLSNSSMEDDYHKADTSKETTLTFVLGETKVVGTSIQKSNSKSNAGLPGVRNVPVLKWFTAAEKSDSSNVQLLILACPHIDDNKAEPMTIDVGNAEKIYGDHKKGMDENGNKKSLLKPSTWFGK